MIALLLSLSVAWPILPTSPVQPIWLWEADQLPIDVLVDVEMLQFEPEISEATTWWNKQLGRKVFNEVGVLTGRGLVLVTPLVEETPKDEVPKVGRASKGGGSGTVRVRQDRAKVQNPLRVFKHEFGHILGLDHSVSPHAVMYQTIEDGVGFITPTEKALVLHWLFKESFNEASN